MTAINATAVRVAWPAPRSRGALVTGYLVRLGFGAPAARAVYVSIHPQQDTALQRTFGGLRAGTVFVADVQALAESNVLDVSSAVGAPGTGATPRRVAVTPAAPVEVAALRTLTALTVEHTLVVAAEGAPGVTGYAVELAVDGAFAGPATLRSTSGAYNGSDPAAVRRVTFDGLLPNTVYGARAQLLTASFQDADSPFSATLMMRTKGRPVAPPPPSFAAAAPNALTVALSPPVRLNGATVTGYAVRLFANDNASDVGVLHADAGPSLTRTFVGLRKSTAYNCEVQALAAAATGEDSPSSARSAPFFTLAQPVRCSTRLVHQRVVAACFTVGIAGPCAPHTRMFHLQQPSCARSRLRMVPVLPRRLLRRLSRARVFSAAPNAASP